MKKIMLFLILIAVLTACFVFPVSAEELSGTCGDSVTWTINQATGVMTISGSGSMDAGDHPVWFDYRDSVKKLIIEDGVTTISYSAFFGFKKLTSVSLPQSLYSIGESAFSGCYSLSGISIPEGVAYIGKYAFNNCSGLCSANIPAALTQIAYGAFSGCSSLASVQLHEGITKIHSYAFYECSALQSITIPSTVTTIGGSAFMLSGLQNITLSPNLQEISGNTFQNCSKLTQIDIPDSVKSIGKNAFTSCGSLHTVNLGAGVSSIAVTSFDGCRALTAFSLSSSNGSYSLDRGVLYNKSMTTMFLMPKGFSGAYTIPSGTTSVGSYAAYGCKGITSLTVPGSVQTIEDYAFDECAGIQSIRFGNGLRKIDLYAFARCFGLTEITFPSSLELIDSLAFSGCTNLHKIVFTGNAPEIKELAFNDVNADVHYPAEKWGWNKAEGNYGGDLEWYSSGCNGKHTLVKDPAKQPTCTEPGLTEGTHCSACGQVLTEQKELPPVHTFGGWTVVKEATEQENGLAQRVCNLCNYTEEKVLTKEAPPVTQPATDPSTATQENSQVETEPTGTEPAPQETLPSEVTDAPTAADEEQVMQTVPSEPLSVQDQEEKTDENPVYVWIAVGVGFVLAAGASILLPKKRK